MKIAIESLPTDGLYRLVEAGREEVVVGTAATVMHIVASAICIEENAKVFRENKKRRKAA